MCVLLCERPQGGPIEKREGVRRRAQCLPCGGSRSEPPSEVGGADKVAVVEAVDATAVGG